MSLYKRKNSKYYWVKFTFDGNLIQQSTKLSSRKDALLFEYALKISVAAKRVNPVGNGLTFYKEDLEKELFESKQQFIYLIQAKNSNRFKIGIAADPANRLRQLQTGSPQKLELKAVVIGNRNTEFSFHKKLWKYNCGGEWFEIPTDKQNEIFELFIQSSPQKKAESVALSA